MKRIFLSTIKRTPFNLPIRKALGTFALAIACGSCSFLDIMPDNVVVIDHAFSNSTEAEKYLFTCYNYLPDNGDPRTNVAMLAGDECWVPEEQPEFRFESWEIARGYQGKSNPPLNTWDGFRSGKPLFKGIRNCNILIETLSDRSKVPDLQLDKRVRWIGEAEFLKAYYHFLLWKQYGPIPITDKNIPVYATPEEVRVKRDPSDKCVSYIVNLIDQSIEKLPRVISRPIDEMGRVTRSVALAVKAKVLLYAASPLFNGNSDYANFKNIDGELMFNPDFDITKWEAAATAAKEAIVEAEEAGAELFEFENYSPNEFTEEGMIMMNIRNAVCERWNKETIWGNARSRAHDLQRLCMPLLTEKTDFNHACMILSAPLKIAEMFYTRNGVPINEDRTLDFADYKKLRKATERENAYIEKDYETARLNFDREPRFYASLGFDGGRWMMYNTPSHKESETYVYKCKKGQIGNGNIFGKYSVTGYMVKKLVNWESVFEDKTIIKEYPWPEMRLADLYLMYAEALNECKPTPESDVYTYLDKVRARAGLKGIKESWSAYSSNPQKPNTQVGMRSIIQQERNIELAFEGSRFWDLRRWKKAAEVLNQPITGWTITQPSATAYYQPRTIFQQKFVAPRDYLWPLRVDELSVNFYLVQNPGW